MYWMMYVPLRTRTTDHDCTDAQHSYEISTELVRGGLTSTYLNVHALDKDQSTLLSVVSISCSTHLYCVKNTRALSYMYCCFCVFLWLLPHDFLRKKSFAAIARSAGTVQASTLEAAPALLGPAHPPASTASVSSRMAAAAPSKWV